MAERESQVVEVGGYRLTKEEQEECNAIAVEGADAADKFRAMLEKTPRGMVVFMAALDCIHRAYPTLIIHTADDAVPLIIVEWVAAGKPEHLAEIPGLLQQRYKGGA